MRTCILLTAITALFVTGCYITPAGPPPRRMVERDVIDSNGYVVERQYYEEGPAPAPLVEVVPVQPYPAAIWVRGYWYPDRYRRRWIWVRGYWR